MKVKKIWQKPVFFVGVSFDVRSNAVFVIRATVENGNCSVGTGALEDFGIGLNARIVLNGLVIICHYFSKCLKFAKQHCPDGFLISQAQTPDFVF